MFMQETKGILRCILWSLFFLGALVLETTVFTRFRLWGAVPDLLLISVVFAGLFRGTRYAVVLGFIFGLAEDVFLGRHIGLNALSKMLIGYLAGRGREYVFRENFLVPPLAVFVATLTCESVVIILANLVGIGGPTAGSIWRLVLPSAIYNGVLTFVGYGGLYRILNRDKADGAC